MEAIVTPIQFLLVYILCRDSDIRTSAGLLCAVFVLDITPISATYYYWIHTLFDLMILAAIYPLKNNIKTYLIGGITICSLSMNIYEGLSYYQTFIYPYRDVIQWWMVEIMFVILAWNCNWRGIGHVKLRRINN